MFLTFYPKRTLVFLVRVYLPPVAILTLFVFVSEKNQKRIKQIDPGDF